MEADEDEEDDEEEEIEYVNEDELDLGEVTEIDSPQRPMAYRYHCALHGRQDSSMSSAGCCGDADEPRDSFGIIDRSSACQPSTPPGCILSTLS